MQWCSHFGKIVWQVSKRVNIKSPNNPAISLLVMYSRETKTYITGFSPGPYTPWSQGRTPSLLFARVSCEVLPRSGAEQELPLLPLEGRRMEEFVDPFLNPRSLLNSNEQGKETRVPELSKEEGMIVCKQGGQ